MTQLDWERNIDQWGYQFVWVYVEYPCKNYVAGSFACIVIMEFVYLNENLGR